MQHAAMHSQHCLKVRSCALTASFGILALSSIRHFAVTLLPAPLFACALQDAYDWAGARVILDVGGGRGELLSSAMSWAGPQAKGLLLDREMVIDRWDVERCVEGMPQLVAA